MSDVRDLLREAARAERPDSTRMSERLDRREGRALRGRRDGADREGGPGAEHAGLWWPRALLAATVVSGVCLVGGLLAPGVLRAGEGGGAPAPPPGSVTAEGTPSAPATPPPGRRAMDGPLWADGSVVPGEALGRSGSEVTLKTGETLTELTVVLLLAPGEVRSPAASLSLPASDFRHSVGEQGSLVEHRWVLRAGRSVPPGTHVFALRYGHPRDGRDAGGDSYWAAARTSAEVHTVRGDFAPGG